MVERKAVHIKFYPSFNELDNEPQDEVVYVGKTREDILTLLGLKDIASENDCVFIELINKKVVDDNG